MPLRDAAREVAVSRDHSRDDAKEILSRFALACSRKLNQMLCEFDVREAHQQTPIKRKRHIPEEIIKKLREAAAQWAGGQSVEEVCKKLEVERRMEARDIVRILDAAVVELGCPP